MKTPDGKEFQDAKRARPLIKAARVVAAIAMIILRALGKFIITVWRLAAALDSALWRASKLAARKAGTAALIATGWALAACRGLLRWLPTRSGRAYSAFSGIVLIIAGLWIIDYVRAGPSVEMSGQSVLRPPIDEEDPILARIEGRYVHLSEIEAAARAGGFLREDETLTPESAFSRELVEAYVEQRLLARAALNSGLQRTPQVFRRVNAARDHVLAGAFIEDRMNASVTPEKVRQLYDSTAGVTRLGDEVRARHIVVATGAEADEIVKLLEGGADFGELARSRSIDRATAPLGGEVGWFTKAMMAPAFANAAFSTAPGNVAAPFQTEFGWHVLEILGRRATSDVPFEAVKDNIAEYLRLRTIDTTIAELAEENQVVYFRPEEEASGASASNPPPDLTRTDATDRRSDEGTLR